jgi:hypothetical protein
LQVGERILPQGFPLHNKLSLFFRVSCHLYKVFTDFIDD